MAGEINRMKFQTDSRLAVLRDLGNQLQIKAEKMRLMARAEEGISEGNYNPYTTAHISEETAQLLEVNKTGDFGLNAIKPEKEVPVSAPRQRRRTKKVKSGSTGQTTVDIKQYRPGYTWNRGGRMKEIRIRHLARKFLCLWKKKVFGRVTISQAREHYKRRLLRTTFKLWYDMWWVLRKEWRLEIRAECHHRHVLWQKTFHAWKEYIFKKRIKNAKLALAEKHASCKLKKKCIMGWWLYVCSRRQKTARNKKALAYREHYLQRVYWGRWISGHNLIQHRQHMESVALQFWAYRVQAQYWLVWQSKLSEKKSAVVKYYRAVRHNNTVVVRRCLKAWISYWRLRKQKKQEKELCRKIYHSTLTQQTFGAWLREYRYRENLKERQGRIVQLGETFQKRRVFLHWKHYVLQQREKYEMIADAENHYRKKLLKMGLCAFRLCVVQKRLKVMRNQMADQLRYRQLTRWGWLTWLSRCEDKEELLMVTQSHKAWVHYRRVLLRRCFYQLQAYAEWRKYRQAQYAKADAHFYMQTMPKYLFAIKVFVQLMKNRRENAQKVLEFRRENTLARFFYSWINQYEFSKEYRMNERMAILHYDDKLVKRYYVAWKQKTAEAQKDAEKEELAVEHYSETLSRKHFKAWKDYILFLKKSQRQDIEASRYYCRKIMKKCIHIWIQYTRKRREKKHKLQRATNHYHRKLCQKMIAMWLHYIDMQRAIMARVEVLYRKKCAQFLSEAFCTWRENVAAQKLQRHSVLVAEGHYRLKIQSKVFTAWHRFSAIHAYKKSETKQWVESARQHLDLKLQEIYFIKWINNHKEHMSMRLKQAEAVEHHSVKVKQKVMVTWKLFTKESIRKTLLQKQCDWFSGMRLTARYFIAWKHALSAADTEKQKTSLALWHWCLTLHRKVLMAWYDYTLLRKHKKQRLQEAMEHRRLRLLKDGVSQWLRVADDMSAMRKRFAVQQQAKNVYETYQVVLRCGLHWKNWASKQRQLREGKHPRAGRILHGVDGSKGEKSGHTSISATGSAYGGDELKGNKSVSSTPRFPVSLFNTPREVTGEQAISTKKEPQLPAPVPTASPGRTSLPGGRGQTRSRPRQPSFLLESLKRAGLFVHSTTGEENTTLVSLQTELPPVERLNLSNLTTNSSGSESERTVTSSVQHHHHQRQQQDIVSARSDLTGSSLTLTLPFQNFSEIQEPVKPRDPAGSTSVPRPLLQNLKETGEPDGAYVPSSDGQTLQGAQLLSTGAINANEMREGYVSLIDFTKFQQNMYPPVQQVPVLPKYALMTPADFLKTTTDVTHNKMLYPQSTSEISSTVVSECITVALTPRVLCQSTDHGNPLSETRSFGVSDFKEQVTPRSTTSVVTPREELSSPGFEAMSTKEVQKEIVTIRNRLKNYEQKKKKLRTMQKQLKQLSDWLKDVEVRGQESEDDVNCARQEVKELSADVDSLKKALEEEKIGCADLVERVKILTAQLST